MIDATLLAVVGWLVLFQLLLIGNDVGVFERIGAALDTMEGWIFH